MPAWIPVVLDFHRTLREALAVKLWLATRIGRDGAVTPAVVDAFCAAHPGVDADAAFLERHHHPPGGRVLSIVWDAVGREHGLTAEEIRRAVFGEI